MNDKRVKYGEVYFSVIEDENPTDSVRITDKSVEDGQPLVDHIQAEASTIRVKGMMVGDNASEQLQLLKKYMYNGERHTYIGRNTYNDMMIESIPRNHTRYISNGFEFSITFVNAKIAKTKTFKFENAVNPTTKKKDITVKVKTKPVTNAGRKQVKTTETKTDTNSPRRRSVVERSVVEVDPIQKHINFLTNLQPDKPKSPFDNMLSVRNLYIPKPTGSGGGVR